MWMRRLANGLVRWPPVGWGGKDEGWSLCLGEQCFLQHRSHRAVCSWKVVSQAMLPHLHSALCLPPPQPQVSRPTFLFPTSAPSLPRLPPRLPHLPNIIMPRHHDEDDSADEQRRSTRRITRSTSRYVPACRGPLARPPSRPPLFSLLPSTLLHTLHLLFISQVPR